MRFTNQFVSYAFDWLLLLHGPIRDFVYKLLVNSNISFRTSQRTCELRNEVRNICGQSFVKSTVKSSPGWGIFHSQLAQGPCISLQVVSRHPGIYTIITNQIKCPGVFPGGGWLLLELTHALPSALFAITNFCCPIKQAPLLSGHIGEVLKVSA